MRTRLGRGDVERRRLGRRFQLVARRELEQVPQGPGAEALVLVEANAGCAEGSFAWGDMSWISKLSVIF